MQLGEVIYGGVGSGLYGVLVFALVAAFVAGLMIARMSRGCATLRPARTWRCCATSL
jgi:uncharacterized membrane protein